MWVSRSIAVSSYTNERNDNEWLDDDRRTNDEWQKNINPYNEIHRMRLILNIKSRKEFNACGQGCYNDKLQLNARKILWCERAANETCRFVNVSFLRSTENASRNVKGYFQFLGFQEKYEKCCQAIVMIWWTWDGWMFWFVLWQQPIMYLPLDSNIVKQRPVHQETDQLRFHSSLTCINFVAFEAFRRRWRIHPFSYLVVSFCHSLLTMVERLQNKTILFLLTQSISSTAVKMDQQRIERVDNSKFKIMFCLFVSWYWKNCLVSECIQGYIQECHVSAQMLIVANNFYVIERPRLLNELMILSFSTLFGHTMIYF